jgi:ferritin-like protein
MSSEGFHVPFDRLSDHTKTIHYAISSLKEELEAVDWYYQRADDTDDADLKAILLHNAHEEIEHASMVLEWLRRADKTFDENLREYLFQDGSIVGREHEVEGKPSDND